MDIYKDLMQALSDRVDANRSMAYEMLKNTKHTKLSIFTYMFYVLVGILFGFIISHGTYSILFIGIFGSTGFFLSAAVFREYLIMNKKINTLIKLVLINEEERKHKILSEMRPINLKR